MGDEVKVGRREATPVMAKRFPVRMSTIGAGLSQAFGEAYGQVQAGGLGTEGPPFVIYHGTPAGDDPFDVELCVPLTGPADIAAEWTLRELPAGLFATLVHVGPYDRLGETYGRLTEWVGAHDLVVAGPPREVYLSGPEVPQEATRTIVEFPVREVAAGGG